MTKALRRWIALTLVALICLDGVPAGLAAPNLTEETLMDGIGIRPMGFGGAFTAVADDQNAAFYNPAGLGDYGVFSYGQGDMDINAGRYRFRPYSFINFGPIGYISWNNTDRTGQSVDVTGYAIGRKGALGINYGITYKSVRTSLASGTTVNWTSDFGMLFKMTPFLSVGFLLADVATDSAINASGHARAGGALRLFNDTLLLAADGEFRPPHAGGLVYHAGAEWGITDGLKLRGGFNDGDVTAGLGFQLPYMDIDYAYESDIRDGFGAIHRFGVTLLPMRRLRRPFSFVKPPEYALVDIGGDLTGGQNRFSIFGGFSFGADSIIGHIKRAAKDQGIEGIIVRIRGFGGGLASRSIIQDIRSELIRAKERGKKIVVYLDHGADANEYYLASVGDIIVAPEAAAFGPFGTSYAAQRLTGLLDKIGVEMQVFAKGRYKASTNPFSPGYTPEQKEEMAGVISSLHRQMVEDIANDRKMDMAKWKLYTDGRLFSIPTAKSLNMITNVGYYDDALILAAKQHGHEGKVKIIPPDLIEDIWGEDYVVAYLPRIAVIEIDGEIVTGRGGDDILFGGRVVGADDITEQIDLATNDPLVRAILVRINSGGGSAIASANIYEALMGAKKEKKVIVASMGDLAASGGYFIASAADKIVADPGTLTGSIGVIAQIPVMKGLYDKLGIRHETIKEGEHTDQFSGLRKMSQAERERFMSLLNETYDQFVQSVARGRKMPTAEVEALAQGRIYTGTQAKNKKLVDELGGFSRAIELTKSLSEVKGRALLVFYREPVPFGYPMLAQIAESVGLGPLAGYNRAKMDRIQRIAD